MDKVPPVFGQRPLPYNTILNDTLGCAYGRDSIYLLGAVDTSVSTSTEPYFLCSLKVSQTPFCSTQYNASSSGATLEAICEDPNDDLEYIKSLGNATSGNSSLNLDWVNIASEWGHSKCDSASFVTITDEPWISNFWLTNESRLVSERRHRWRKRQQRSVAVSALSLESVR